MGQTYKRFFEYLVNRIYELSREDEELQELRKIKEYLVSADAMCTICNKNPAIIDDFKCVEINECFNYEYCSNRMCEDCYEYCNQCYSNFCPECYKDDMCNKYF